MGLGAWTYTGVKSLHTVVKRYDDVVDCKSGFFPTEAEREHKMSNDGLGKTCSIEFDAETTLEKPVYVYYEIEQLFSKSSGVCAGFGLLSAHGKLVEWGFVHDARVDGER